MYVCEERGLWNFARQHNLLRLTPWSFRTREASACTRQQWSDSVKQTSQSCFNTMRERKKKMRERKSVESPILPPWPHCHAPSRLGRGQLKEATSYNSTFAPWTMVKLYRPIKLKMRIAGEKFDKKNLFFCWIIPYGKKTIELIIVTIRN